MRCLIRETGARRRPLKRQQQRGLTDKHSVGLLTQIKFDESFDIIVITRHRKATDKLLQFFERRKPEVTGVTYIKVSVYLLFGELEQAFDYKNKSKKSYCLNVQKAARWIRKRFNI